MFKTIDIKHTSNHSKLSYFHKFLYDARFMCAPDGRACIDIAIKRVFVGDIRTGTYNG
jgi:hypothetical protein